MSAKHTNRKYLNIWEVEALLPKVEFYVSEMTRLRHQMLRLARRVGACGGLLKFDDPPVFSNNPAVAAMEKKLYDLTKGYVSLINLLVRMGIVVDDLDVGAFDFYSLYEGQEILFCWQYGEEDVQYWHYPGEQFKDRRHVEVLLKRPGYMTSQLH